MLATRWNQTPDAVAGLGLWDGKIVIDLGGRTSREVVAALVPGGRGLRERGRLFGGA